MNLHIYINSQQKLCATIQPGEVRRTLDMIQERMGDLASQGRVCVALDSDTHKNVTYLLNREAYALNMPATLEPKRVG